MPLYGKIIVIKRNGADGYNFPLTTSSCLFGRKTDCDIRIQLPHVSKEHCKLEVNENNEVILTNLSEVNRTCLNGEVVLQSERLKHRDMFTVIDRSFRFEYPLDSVHNTSPRKKRNSSSLKNETLQVLHVQQGVDDGSQPSGKGRLSTSGRKSDTVGVDKVFEVLTKSEKTTPNARQDPAPKNLRRRSATKILNDEQPADLLPFSKLYEMFKQQATKPIQPKPKKINMHVSVKESSTDLTKQSSVPAKESDVTISQYDKNPRASPSARRTSGRMSKIRLEERKMAKDADSENEEMSNLETLLVHGITTVDLAKPTADINTPKKNNASVELNKFTENLSSEAKVTSLAFSDVGVKGKEQNNHLSTKGTPKAEQKSQHFTTHRSLTADEPLMECQEMLEPSVGKGQSMVMKNKTIEMEHTPVVIDEKKAEIPKKPSRPSLCNKNVEAANIQAEQAESAEILEPSTAAKSEEEDKSVEMEHTHTPKKHGRPSLRNKNVEAADIQAESAEVSAPSVAAKSPVLIKQKSGTSSCSLHLLSERRKSDAPENLTKAGRLKKKRRASKSPQRDLTNKQSEKTELMQEMPASSTISPRWHSGRLSITSLAGEDHIGPMNTATEQLGKSSVVDVELDFYTSSQESPSSPAAVPYLSKKHRSEKEETFYGPVSKRKKVSFGANLSPEVFDKRMPPSSPLRKGGTPTRVSTPFRCTPRAAVKRASSMGIHTCTIQEFSELNENYSSPIRSNIPSARASPVQTQKSPAKIPSSGKMSSLTTGVKSPAKRPSSVKTPSLLVVKQSPDAKTPLPAKTPSLPSIKRSPAAKTPSQSKTASLATKKSSVAKVLSSLSLRKLVTNKMSSPIAGSFDCSPNVRGCFSISHVATPSILTRSMPPHITPTPLNLAMFEQPQQKASLVATSGKKPSRKSTRKSASLFAAIHSRRQTGASAANLLVNKSWAQVVKEGVAKPQLRCAGKKSVVMQRRTKNIVSLKVVKTPVRLVKGHFSTGHAASPATIVIGKSQATTIKPTGQAPRIARTVSLRRKDYEMNESFTGITEMFRTPTNENEKANPVLCISNIVDDAQTALATPIPQKSFEDSVIKTPEETGEMDVSPLTSPGTRSSRRYNNAVSRLLRCRADFFSSSNDICESIPKVPKVRGKPVEDMDDVQQIMKTSRVKGKPVEDMDDVQQIMKTSRVKGKPVEDIVGVQRIMKTPRVKGKPVEDMVGVKRIMKTPRVKEKPVENFVGLHKLMAEPKQKAESPEISYVGIKKLFHTGKEMESCDYSGLGEMFSTPIRTERSSDSEQQQSSTSTNKRATCKPSTLLEKICGDGQTIETSEHKLIQIVEQRSGQPSTTKTSPRETGCNLSLTPGVEVTRTRQAKSINSPSSKEECMQQPDQLGTSQTFPKDDHVDFTEREINESKDGQAVVNKLVSPTRKSLKGKKEIQDTGAEESPTTIKSTTLGKNGSPVEQIEEVSKIVSRKSLKGKKIEDVQDADLKMLLTPSKITPGKKESPHEQTEEVIVLKPQTRRSLKEKSEIQNIQDVELEELPGSIIKSATSSKNESPGKKSEEVNKLVSPIMKSLRGMKKVQGSEMKELFTFGKTTTLDKKESQDGQTGEVNEMASPVRKSLEGKKETQNVEVIRPPTSARACTQDKKQTPVAQIEEVVHLTSRERSQRRNKETESTQNTEVKESPAVAKTSQGKKETQYAKIEEPDKSSLRKTSQKKNEIENVESVVMKNGLASPKTSIKATEKVKDLPVEDVKAPITTGRPQRRKNINVEETEMQKPPGTTNGYTRKRGVRCAHVENVKESISLQRDQEKVDKAKVNSGPEGSVREGVKTENVKILEKKDLASSKYRSTRGKRANKDLLLEEFKQDSVPAKRLRREEKVEEASLRKSVHWGSNLTSPKLADCAVEILQETFNGTELPVLERRSQRGKAAKKEVNPQVSLGSIETSRKAVSKHENSKVITDANQFLDSAKQQKGRPKRKEADVPCEPLEFTKKDKYDAENVNEGIPVMKMYKKETNQHTESVLKLSPTPIKRLLRGKVGQKVTQNKENVKELSSTRKSKRNITEQKFMAATGEEPHVPVKIPLVKEEKHKMTEEEYMPSSRTMGKGKKGKQTKESLVEGEAVPEQTEQQLNVPTVDVQLDTARLLLQENEPTAQKVKSKVCQQAKAPAKGTLACLSNVEDVTVGEMGAQEKRSHLDVRVGGSEVVNNSDIISKTEATKQTRFPNKGKVTNTAAKASEVTSDTKKMDVILPHRYEIKEDTRPKRSVRKGRSAKEIATESEVRSLVPDTTEETAERQNSSKRASKESTQTKEDAQKTKSDSKKLPGPAINRRRKRKITKEDAPSVVQEICEEGLQVKDAAVDPVEAPRRGGRGMVKRNMAAVINRELSLGTTEDKQVVESSVNNAERNQRSRRGQNCYDKGTAILSVAQVEKDELINKRGTRPNLDVQTNSDQNIQSRKDEVEDKGKKQEIGFLSVESSKPAKRATRANKFCEAAGIEQISIQPLTPASLCPSKRTFRGKQTVAETTDVSPKKAKMEKMTGKVTTQVRKTGKAVVSTKKRLPVTPQPAKPSGRTTRSRK